MFSIPVFFLEFNIFIFFSERIYGYKNLKINILILKQSLRAYFDCKFESQIDLDTLKVENLQEHFADTLGLDLCHSRQEFDNCMKQDFRFKPLGRTIMQFSKGDNSYMINSITNKLSAEEAQLIERFQSLNHFYIEYARNIDLDDPKWGFLVVFCKDSEGKFSTAGFLSFYNYISFPNKIRRRISQVLVLPEFQGCQVGTHLLHAFYKDCWETENVQDMTVEEPSEHFTHIRDKLDFTILINDENLSLKNWFKFKNYVLNKYKFNAVIFIFLLTYLFVFLINVFFIIFLATDLENVSLVQNQECMR